MIHRQGWPLSSFTRWIIGQSLRKALFFPSPKPHDKMGNMMSGIFIEKNDEGNFCVSFPLDSEYRSENDDLEFYSVDDALEFLDENCFVWGRLELQYVKRVCPECRDKGYLVRRDDSTIYVERCDVCEMFASDRDATIHILSELEKGV